MNINKKEKGKAGENLAEKFLLSKGYKIIERNFRGNSGEIDIIAFSDDETLCFVEVRTEENEELNPLETVNYKKRRKIEKTAKEYIMKKKLWDKMISFDVIGIYSGKKNNIIHIKNAFMEGE